MESVFAKKYSVIVPVYNSEKTLRRCVDSVLAQTYGDFELILVDDGSYDSSAALVDEYASVDPRVVAIHKANGGVSSARNVGLDYAKGEFVVFVDADDIITPPHLSEYQQYSVDVAIGGIIIDKGGESITEIISDVSRNIKVEDIGHFIDENSATSVFRGPFCKAFRRNVIEKNHIRFDERLNWGEDYLFVLEILSKSQSVAVLSGSTYIYYADSVTPGKYQMTALQYELYITQTEQILKEYNCNKFIDINRLWAYQTMLGFIGSRSMREKMRECFKFILGRHWHYLPERQRRSKLNFLIELIRVALLS